GAHRAPRRVMAILLVVVAFGVGGAAYLYFEGLGAKGRLLAGLRGASGALLALLLLDLTCARSDAASRPLVLLDGSLSMTATGGIPPGVTLELLGSAAAPLLSRPVTLGPSGGHAVLRLPSRSLGAGDHLLSIRVRASGDAEPRDDLRQLLVRVTPLPGAVLLA